jgi:hypothetical protein
VVGGWAVRLPATGWNKGFRISVIDVGGLHQKKHTLLEVDTHTLKNPCVIIDVV